MNVLFLVPYPLNESPSQRFRFEQYFDALRNEGHSYKVQSFLDRHNWREFSRPGNLFVKAVTLMRGFARRLRIFAYLSKYHLVFIHREAAPVGPPILEWLIARVFKKRIIYDFDDAIWFTDEERESALFKVIKWRSKIKHICRWSYKVSCGNNFLCNFALKFNKSVVLNPTTVDTEELHVPSRSRKNMDGPIVIGWTGSYSTAKYLNLVEDVLRAFAACYPTVNFLVISEFEPSLKLDSLRFKRWNVDTEIEDLARIDIGIMPLPDDDWSKGKCGFKALQYMALEIPTVVSPVGVNTVMIDHGVNGFLAATNDEWKKYLTLLVENKQLREEMGKKGRQKVVDQFSVRSNCSTFLSLFR
jgi:glycosyltransferase involved in cell wall biosynthesis